MTAAPPILLYVWDGESMVPLPRFAKKCDEVFVVGQTYPLEVREDRSWKSHGHYFACVNDAWGNLREDLAERFPTPDHLRKWALIKSGYADSRQFVAGSKAEAVRLAAFLKPCDEYAIVTVSECVVTEWKARSQDLRSMPKKEFQASKDAVLDVLAGMVKVKPEVLAANAGRAA
jgi:hypothetical protein